MNGIALRKPPVQKESGEKTPLTLTWSDEKKRIKNSFSVTLFLASFILLAMSFALIKYSDSQQTKYAKTQQTLQNLKLLLESAAITPLQLSTLTDAWGTPFYIQYEKGTLQITSLGSDKKPGGQGNAADFSIEARPNSPLSE